MECVTRETQFQIRAGTLEEVNFCVGRWVFVDLGFSAKKRSCGFLLHDGEACTRTFGEVQSLLLAEAKSCNEPLNLVLEAPLSVAFNKQGNPAGRTIERRGKATRYWYVGAGCCTLIAATRLLHKLTKAERTREIRLFEGFASFRDRGERRPEQHQLDVYALRSVVRDQSRRDERYGRVIAGTDIVDSADLTLQSAFVATGMDFCIPPVIMVD